MGGQEGRTWSCCGSAPRPPCSKRGKFLAAVPGTKEGHPMGWEISTAAADNCRQAEGSPSTGPCPSPALLLAPRQVTARHIPALAASGQGTGGRKEQVSPYLLLNHSHAQHFCDTGVW